MFRVIIINAPEDATAADILVDQLRALDLEAKSGIEGAELREAIEQANVAIALWSPHSRDRIDLADAARHGKEFARVVHLRIANAAPPADFGFNAAIDLTGWRGEPTFPPWLQFLEAISKILYAPPPEDDSAFVMPDAPAQEAPAHGARGAGLFETIESPEPVPDRAPPRVITRYRPAARSGLARERKSLAGAMAMLALLLAVGAGGSALWFGRGNAPTVKVNEIDLAATPPFPVAAPTLPSEIDETPLRIVQAELRPTRAATQEAPARRRSSARNAARAEERGPTPRTARPYAELPPFEPSTQTDLAATSYPGAPSLEPARARGSTGEATFTYVAPSAPQPSTIAIVEEPPRRRRAREARSEQLAGVQPLPGVEAAAPSSPGAEEAARRERRLRRAQLRQERMARAERMQRSLDPLGRLGERPLGVGLCNGGVAGLGLGGALSTRC